MHPYLKDPDTAAVLKCLFEDASSKYEFASMIHEMYPEEPKSNKLAEQAWTAFSAACTAKAATEISFQAEDTKETEVSQSKLPVDLNYKPRVDGVEADRVTEDEYFAKIGTIDKEIARLKKMNIDSPVMRARLKRLAAAREELVALMDEAHAEEYADEEGLDEVEITDATAEETTESAS